MTDLFNNYYNNPRKQAIFADMTCPGALSENDKSFRFGDEAAEIINSNDVISGIKLDNVSSNVSDWNVINKTLKANDIIYIAGDSNGASYKQYGFGFIDSSANIFRFIFCVDYLDNNNMPIHNKFMFDSESAVQISDIIVKIKNFFNDNKIRLDASLINYNDDVAKGNIIITSTNLGQDFYISNMSYLTINDAGNYEHKILENNNYYYIPNYKYRNGAFKGIIVKADYPKYNNDIASNKKSLLLTHIIDRVPVYYKDSIDLDLYHKYYVDVFGNLILKDETYKVTDSVKDVSDDWINDDQNYISYNGLNLLRRDAMGLYGFCNYATANNLWKNFGDFYSIISSDDVENETPKNLNNGIIIYNPNNFDIKLNIMTWN